MFQKEYLELLGSRNVWRVVRLIFGNLHVAFGITEIADTLGISKSNAYRALERLDSLGLLTAMKSGRKALYQVDSSHPFSRPIWELVEVERYVGIRPDFKNAIDFFLSRIDHGSVHAIVLFGSVARGLAEKWSDVDLLGIPKNDRAERDIKRAAKEMFPDYKFELHVYSHDGFVALQDLVVLDAVLNGIPLVGMSYVFDKKKELRSFPRAYLVYRLNQAKKISKMVQSVQGDARDYLRRVLFTSLTEIDALLEKGVTLPKAAARPKSDVEREIKRLETEIAGMGDRIWLT